MRVSIVFTLFFLLSSSPTFAQQPKPGSEPPLRRWFEFQQFALSTRYRFTENNRDVTTSNHLQYKDSVRARFNLDPHKRYTVNFGFFTGNNFSGSWNNWGLGNDTTFDGKDNYFKQFYGSATPVDGFELQFGGLYINRGDGDEWLTYDDDGYLVGGRASVRRPKEMYLDEITVTRGTIGPLNKPSLGDRWNLLDDPNYTQVLGVKHFNKMIGGSLEYDRQIGSDILRAAVTLHFPAKAPVTAVRYQQYRRFNQHAANGFALWAERPVTKHLRLQGGYVSVDQFYGGWNADRMQNGRRFFASASMPIYGPLSASLYATAALDEPYSVSIHRRFDAVIQYDVLNSLHRTGIF